MSEFLVLLLNSFISTFGYTYLYCKFVNIKKWYKVTKLSLLIFVVASITLAVVNYFNFSILKFSIFFVFYPVLFYNINKLSMRKNIFYVVFIWLFGAISNIIIMILISLILYFIEINDVFFLTNFMSLLMSIFAVLLGNIKKFVDFVNNLYLRFVKVKYSDISLISFVIFVFVGGSLVFFNLPNLEISILILLIILLVLMIFILLIKYKINENENTSYLETLRKNNEFYMQIEDDNREFKHNLIAKLLSIKSVSNKKGMALIEDLIRQFNKSIDFSESIKVIPYGLNGIIYQKLYAHLKELNVKIVNDLNYDIFTVLKPRRYNVFVEKLVLALDNAIESSLNSHDKILVINIYDEDNLIAVDIKNSFANDIDIDMLGSKNYSTKGSKRGIGLFSMFRDKEAEVSVKIVNNLFVSKITTKKRLSD